MQRDLKEFDCEKPSPIGRMGKTVRSILLLVIVFFIATLFSCQKEDDSKRIGQEEASIPPESKDITEAPLESEQTVFFQSVGIFNDSNVRIRTNPSIESEVVGSSMKGDRVEVLGKSPFYQKIDEMFSPWVKIKTLEGVEGWSYGYFIDVDMDPLDELPISYTEPESQNKEGVIYPENDEFIEAIPILTTQESHFFYLDNNVVVKTGPSFSAFEKYKITGDSFFNGPIVDGIKYLNLIDEKESSLYLRESNLIYLPAPYDLHFTENDNPDFLTAMNDYSYNDNLEEEDQRRMIYKRNDSYLVYDRVLHQNRTWLLISDVRNEMSSGGWVSDRQAKLVLDPEQDKSARRHFILENIFNFAVDDYVMGFGVEGVIKRFGEPNTIYADPIINRHTDKEDFIYHMYYDGLYLSFYHVVEIKKNILLTLRLDNNNYPMNNHFTIGSKKDYVIGILGSPNGMDDQSFYYPLDPEGFQTLRFIHDRKGTITQVLLKGRVD